MNWGDELCGVKVTPESWAGPEGQLSCSPYLRGIMEVVKMNTGPEDRFSQEHIGRWSIFTSGAPYLGWGSHTTFFNGRQNVIAHTKPIFPPAGFAGRTDAELWREFVSEVWRVWESSDAPGSGKKARGMVAVNSTGAIFLQHLCCVCSPAPVEDMPALILALSNAQVLAKRLQEATDGQ